MRWTLCVHSFCSRVSELPGIMVPSDGFSGKLYWRASDCTGSNVVSSHGWPSHNATNFPSRHESPVMRSDCSTMIFYMSNNHYILEKWKAGNAWRWIRPDAWLVHPLFRGTHHIPSFSQLQIYSNQGSSRMIFIKIIRSIQITIMIWESSVPPFKSSGILT